MAGNESDPGRRVDAHLTAWVQGPAFVPHESQDLIFDVGAGLLHVVEGSMISTLPLPPDEGWEKDGTRGGEESSLPVDASLPSAPAPLQPSVPSAQSSSASCLPVSPPSPSSSHSSAESTLRAFLASSSSRIRHVAASPNGLLTAVLYDSGALELVDHGAEAVLGTDLDASVPKPALACFWTGGGPTGRELAVAGREGLFCFEPGHEAGLRLTRRLVLADLRWAVHDPRTRVALLGFGAHGTKALPVFLGREEATMTCRTPRSHAPSEDGRRPPAEAGAEAGSTSAKPARAGGMQLPSWAFGRGRASRSSQRAPSRQASSRAESPAPSRPSTPREAGRDRNEGFVKYPVLDLAPPWGAGAGAAEEAGAGRRDAAADAASTDASWRHDVLAQASLAVPGQAADASPDARSLGERLGLWGFWGSNQPSKAPAREDQANSPDSPGHSHVSPPLLAEEVSATFRSSGSARPASPRPHAPPRLPSTLHGVWLLSIYDQPHVAVHSEAAGQLRLLRLRRGLPPEALELRELPPGARVALSVVDDVLVLHLVQARVALLVDVGGSGARRAMEPLCAPLPVRLVSWEEGEGARESGRERRAAEEAEQPESRHRRRRSSVSLSRALSRSLSLSLPAGASHAPHACSQPSSVLALPDWMADRGRGLVARLRLDLPAMAATLAGEGGSETAAAGAADFAAPFLGPRVPSLAPVLAFLQRRRAGRDLSLALLRRLLRAAALGRAGAWRSFQESAEAVLAATRWVRARSGEGRGLDGLDLCRVLLEPMWRDLEAAESEAVYCRDARIEPVFPRNDPLTETVFPRRAATAAVLTRAALALVVWVAPAAQPASAVEAPPAEALLAVQSAARLALRGLRAQNRAHVEEQLRRSWPSAWFALCKEGGEGLQKSSLLDAALAVARGRRVPGVSPGELLAAIARSGDRSLLTAYWRVCRLACAPPAPPLDDVLRYYGLAGFGE